MKRETTKNRATTRIKQMKEDWEDFWDDMAQERIQAEIERILLHIQEVIRLNRGNEYKESKSGRKRNPN